MSMCQVDEQPSLVHAIERIRLKAGRLEQQLIDLNHMIRFDSRMPGLAERAGLLEGEARELTNDLQALRVQLQRATGQQA